MRIVFAGSPSFAVPSLAKLVEAKHEIVCVITQPDRPAGRGLEMRAPAVKRFALDCGLKVCQPEKFNSRHFLDSLEALGPDLVVVAAYGRIFRRRSLSIPRMGCVNLHASLLPKYRGVAPGNWAIINGETETGVTTFFMDEGVDTGDIILSRRTEIGDRETAGELLERLASIGGDLLTETCDVIEKGDFTCRKQDHSLASYAPKFSKEDGWVRWDRPAKVVDNHVRGVTPWPGAVTSFRDKQVKIIRSRPADLHSGTPGRIIDIDSESGILVSCSSGSVWLKVLQARGKNPVGGADFARGYRIQVGEFFGAEKDCDP